MQHLETIWGAVRTQGLHSFPFSTRSRFSLAHLDDLAAAATRVLTEDGHENAIYELAGPQALTQNVAGEGLRARNLGWSNTLRWSVDSFRR